MSNAYFQIIMNDKGLNVKFYPETGEGSPLNVDEVVKYLDRNKITGYNLVELNRGIMQSKTEPVEVFVCPEKKYVINEYMLVTTVKDDMFAIARFYPPCNEGARMTYDEIVKDLIHAGIKYGIDEKAIKDFIANPRYCTNYVVAKGRLPVQGTDASIEYHFNTDRRLKPKRREDGTVDFHQLGNISHIKQGDVLATLTPAKQGKDGVNVKAGIVKPRSVESKTLKYGLNITLSEDGLKLISDVNGHAMLEGDKVFVSNLYDVPGDVDNSTGDIKYEGNVLVHGTVKTGFKIEATGDVEVLGAVEGAIIKAGGQIILHHGMQGMSRGELEAGGNIIVKFVESATVKSGGFIEADSIIQSNVHAKGDIIIDGSKGFIIGGAVRSSTLVSAKTIGSHMGIATTIEVGVDPSLKEKLGKNGETLKGLNSKLQQSAAVVEMFKKKKEAGKFDKSKLTVYIKAIEEFKTLTQEIEQLNKENEEILNEMGAYEDACVKVIRDIYPGVRVIISDEHYVVNNAISHCKLKKEQGMVKIFPL
ncbi:MAG: DUF342 domain-containing protein [Lachnospiraceae bacterium]|nr:DUF342 domain-containing protein [Lachnospiraceae bacterium]